MSTTNYSKVALLLALVPSLAAAAGLIGSIAPDFVIKDQYDHEVQLSSLRGKPVLLIYGDRLGSDYMSNWAAAVRESARANSVNVIRIANLRAVPSLMRSYVKRQFLKTSAEGKPNAPVLLDWDAGLAKLYTFTEDLTNVYVVDEKGFLRYVACGKGTPEETGKLVDMIVSLSRRP
jgi:hypothetical protein